MTAKGRVAAHVTRYPAVEITQERATGASRQGLAAYQRLRAARQCSHTSQQGSIRSGTPSSETAASNAAALTDRSVNASRIIWTTVPNGASIAAVGSLNLIELTTPTGTPTRKASGSCAARSNALSHSQAVARTRPREPSPLGRRRSQVNCRKEHTPQPALARAAISRRGHGARAKLLSFPNHSVEF